MQNKDSFNRTTLKAGIWYTISTILIRGINFLTTPLFARLLSKTEYGSYSNYASWQNLLMTIVTLDLFTSISRAKIDFPDDMDRYTGSIQVLGTMATGIVYAFVLAFPDKVSSLMELDIKYIHIMFLYLLIAPALTLLQTKERQFLRYKNMVFLTMSSTLLTVGISILLVMLMEDRLAGRIIGSTVTLFIYCFIIYIYNLRKGKSVYRPYWNYAVKISIPLIPHVLAGNILAQTDRIFITKYCGAGDTALYSLGYQCASIVMILGNAVNQAWTPWEFQKLHDKRFEEIRKVSYKYVVLSGIFTVGIMLFAPELVRIFGGEKYKESIGLIPVVMAGIYCWLLYTLFINIENYNKKTFGISVKTVVAAGVNLIGNYLLIPRYGYMMAAYTTLFSYLLLLVLHSASAIKLGAKQYYSFKLVFLAAGVILAFSWGVKWTYKNNTVHYSSIGAVLIVAIVYLVCHREKVKKMLFRLIGK